MGSLTNVRIFGGYDGLACDNMIPPSLESTSCSSAGILNLFLHPFCPGALALFLPLVSAFSGKQPRGSSFVRLVPNLPPADFIKHALSVQCTCACHCVHRADTNSVLRSASTSTGVLRACIFSICRTSCKLQQGVFILSLSCPPSVLALVVEYIAPAPAVYAAPALVMVYIALTQMVSYAVQAQVLEYFAPASSAYAGHSANCNREFHSLPVVPTVYTCTDGGVHRAGTSSLCCTCACHCVHRADTSSVLRRASTSTGVLRACVFSICRTSCKLQQGVSFSPCRAHRLHLHLWWST